MPDTSTKHNVKNSVWTFTTYFAEGFPYTIIRTISSVFFRDNGMSLEALGVTSVFGLPWVLKFLWGPLVDNFATKRKWLLYTETILCVIFLGAALLAPLSAATTLIAALFFMGSFVAATHDIAIDGFYMEALNKDEQARYLGYRVMAYRIAMMTGTGVIATIGAVWSWLGAFLLAALAMTILLIIHYRILPKTERQVRSFALPSINILKSHSLQIILAALAVIAIKSLTQSTLWIDLQRQFPVVKKLNFPAAISLLLFAALIVLWLMRKKLKAMIINNPDSFYTKSFLSFMDREGIGYILLFIIFIRAGEYMLSAMYSPFMVDLGLKNHYGWISAGVGLPCSIAGALIGGWCISRFSLAKMIWPFLLLQNLTNLIYMVLALKLASVISINTANPTPQALSNLQLTAVAAVHAFDQLAGGLGTAVLMTFLMRICRSEFKASHYAIGTGLMSVSGLYAGVVSGFITAQVGYGVFFGLSFLLSVPGMVLIFFIPTNNDGLVKSKGMAK